MSECFLFAALDLFFHRGSEVKLTRVHARLVQMFGFDDGTTVDIFVDARFFQ